MSSGISWRTTTRSKCAAAAAAASAPWKRSTIARASACLASRGDVPAGRRGRPRAARTTSPSPRRAARACARTSPRAPRSPRRGCPATSTSSRRRRVPGQDRHRQHGLLGHAVGALDVAAEQQVEGLVGAAELDVGARRRPSRSPASADRAARGSRSACARRSAWRSRRARAAARPSSCARGAKSSSIDMSSHSQLKRTSKRSGSSSEHPEGLLLVGCGRSRRSPRPRAPGASPSARSGRRRARCSRRRSARRGGRGPGTRAASAARPCGRGGCRASSGRARASRAAGARRARRPPAWPPDRPSGRLSTALRARKAASDGPGSMSGQC